MQSETPEMQAHRERIRLALAQSSRSAKLLFALFAAERLRGCCWSSEGLGEIWGAFSEVLDQAFESLGSGAALRAEMVEKWIALLERVLPDGGGPAEVQAQSAYICLNEGLRCYIDDNIDSVVAVVDAIVDSLDNYLHYWGKRLLVESTVPDSSPLLLRELERQLDDVAFLMNEVNHRREKLIERRFINIQYAVPVVA